MATKKKPRKKKQLTKEDVWPMLEQIAYREKMRGIAKYKTRVGKPAYARTPKKAPTRGYFEYDYTSVSTPRGRSRSAGGRPSTAGFIEFDQAAMAKEQARLAKAQKRPKGKAASQKGRAGFLKMVMSYPEASPTMEIMGFASAKGVIDLDAFVSWIQSLGFTPQGRSSHKFIPNYVTIPTASDFDDYSWTAKSTVIVPIGEGAYAILLDKAQARQSRTKKRATCPKSRCPKKSTAKAVTGPPGTSLAVPGSFPPRPREVKPATRTAVAKKKAAPAPRKRALVERNGFVLVGNLWIHKSKLPG